MLEGFTFINMFSSHRIEASKRGNERIGLFRLRTFKAKAVDAIQIPIKARQGVKTTSLLTGLGMRRLRC